MTDLPAVRAAIHDVRKVSECLYLELSLSAAGDVKGKIDALIQAFTEALDDQRNNALGFHRAWKEATGALEERGATIRRLKGEHQEQGALISDIKFLLKGLIGPGGTAYYEAYEKAKALLGESSEDSRAGSKMTDLPPAAQQAIEGMLDRFQCEIGTAHECSELVPTLRDEALTRAHRIREEIIQAFTLEGPRRIVDEQAEDEGPLPPHIVSLTEATDATAVFSELFGMQDSSYVRRDFVLAERKAILEHVAKLEADLKAHIEAEIYWAKVATEKNEKCLCAPRYPGTDPECPVHEYKPPSPPRRRFG